jgi:DivIVA domain-containing protein
MIHLTPLDVRKKRGDFRRMLRGYEPEEVDAFLDLVADRLEVLTRENLTLGDRVKDLQERVETLGSRERAVNEALVTAQELRAEIKEEAQRQADRLVAEVEAEVEARRRESEAEAERVQSEARADIERQLKTSQRQLEELKTSLQELERTRGRFLNTFRALLEHELDNIAVFEAKASLEDAIPAVDLEEAPPGELAEGEEDTGWPEEAGMDPSSSAQEADRGAQ